MKAETEKYYNEITATLSVANCEEWEAAIVTTEAQRLHDLAAMDILSTTTRHAKSAGHASGPPQTLNNKKQYI